MIVDMQNVHHPSQSTTLDFVIPLGTKPPPPNLPCESNALVRASGGVVSATFGTVSYWALYNFTPNVRAAVGVVRVKFWDFSVGLARGGGLFCCPPGLLLRAADEC